MGQLLVLQLILPLALLAGFAFRSSTNWLGFVVQLLALVALLTALQLAGLWLMPPWWAMWAYWTMLIAATLLALRRRRERRVPGAMGGWIALGLSALLSSYAGWVAILAFVGTRVPSGGLVELHFPLQQGTYLVVNGGSNTSVSSHARTLARATSRQRSYYGQSHAIDLVALNAFGLPSGGINPADPQRYEIFGHTVLAPCDGVVAQAANDKPDMPVPMMDSKHMAGNHVLLRCRDADILLAHFRKGSLRVTRGQRVVTGQPIAEVGNSGNSATPHLHIHAQLPGSPNAPFSGRPLPMTFAGRYLVRGDLISADDWLRAGRPGQP